MDFMLLIFGLILTFGGGGYLIYTFARWNKDPLSEGLEKKDWIKYFALLGAVGIGFAALIGSSFAFHPEWSDIVEFEKGALAGRPINYAENIIKATVFAFFFAVSFAALWTSFSVYYYKRKLNPKQKKIFRITMFAAIAPAVLFFLGWTDALGCYGSYPLPAGIHVGGDFIGFFNAFNKPGDGLNVAFYAIVILSGAGISYFVGDHLLYKSHHKHELFSSTLVAGLIAGIIGGRVWYVVGNYQREFAGRPFTAVFEVWNGGLTILGGAFAGIVVGALWFKFANKQIDIREAIDIAVPTVLLAQALGRFGNFFNVEVYGQPVEVNGIWNVLPSWILQQMNLNSGGGALANGMIHVPLFLIEATLNLGGYFIITKLVPALLKKHMAPGDLCGEYFIWYGIVRFIMEPFRDANFNMGTDNSWSICNSLIYIIIGVGIIACAHLFAALIEKKDKGLTPIWSTIAVAPCLVFPALQSITISAAKDGTGVSQSFGGFEIISKNPLFLVSYIMIVAAFACFLSSYFTKKNNKVAQYLTIGAMGLALLSAIFIIASTNTISHLETEYVNLSYGFFLMVAFAIASACISLMPFMSIPTLKKKENALGKKEEIANEAN